MTVRRTVLFSIGSGLWLAAAALSGRAQEAPTGSAFDAEIRAARDDLASRTSELERLQQERARIESDRVASQTRLRDRARSLYRIRRAGMLPLAGGFDAMLAHVARTARLEQLVRVDLAEARRLRQRLAATDRRLDELERTVADARAAADALSTRQAELAAAQQAIGAVPGFGGAPSPSMSLPIAPLPAGLEGQGTFRVVDDAPIGDGFATRRGQLAMPLLSMAGVRDARRDDGPGIELVTQPGSAVRAVADGRVAFARSYGSYGPMVILEHDDSYYTVYGGLSGFAVDVGDGVAAGAPIGRVGGDALFFEVRRGTRSLDARSWLGL